MDFTCQKCQRDDLSSHNFVTQNPFNIGMDLSIKKLYCQICKICIALQAFQRWKSIDQCLKSTRNGTGWQQIQGPEDLLALYIMSQIMYNENAGDADPLFDMPDTGDIVKIYWLEGAALGFYTVKPKGTLVHSSRESYGAHTLDTAYVLPTCRGMGLGLSMLQDIVMSKPDEDIAFSTPISKSMAHVINKFLQIQPKYRMKLWEVEGAGSHGNRKLLFYTLRKKLS